MSSKKLVYLGVIIGSFVGGYVPSLWGADFFSMSGVFTTAIGGIIGIWLGFKLSAMLES